MDVVCATSLSLSISLLENLSQTLLASSHTTSACARGRVTGVRLVLRPAGGAQRDLLVAVRR